MKDKKLILKGLDLHSDQTIIDLGAGDGTVIFEAAGESMRRKLNTAFVALEINPVLILILWIKWLFHPNRKNIKIIWGNMFDFNFKNVTRLPAGKAGYTLHVTCYLYISPWLIEKVVARVQSQLPLSTFVSYYYPIKSLKQKEKILHGIHPTYLYN